MKIAFISSKGGHLGQIHIIFNQRVLESNTAIIITESEDYKKQGRFKEKAFLSRYREYYFKKDNLRFNPLKYIYALIKIRKILKKEKVGCIVTNGAQLSIPAVIAGKLLGIKTIFIDTVIRVNTPNWSARFSYFFSDIFLVQHPSMAMKYGKKAFYAGGIL